MNRRIGILVAAGVLASVAGVLPVVGARSTAVTRPVARTVPPRPAGNPLLPASVEIGGLYPELTLVQKLPAIVPAGFDPLYSADDWQAYREKFGAEADAIGQKRSSGQIEFAGKMIAAAESEEVAKKPGLQRILLVRAAAISYRTTGGYATANKAMEQFQRVMDVRVPSHSAALWTVANQVARMAVTPKPERIRYSAIAARANMNLALQLMDMDQIDDAQALVKQLGFHEGWLKGDAATRAQIAQVRTAVRQTGAMMEFLGEKYPLAVKGDDDACMAIYLWARYVKQNAPLAQDIVNRKPSSSVAHLHNLLASAEHDPAATYAAAEALRAVAGNMPDSVLKQRAMYGALMNYRAYLAAPQTAGERVKRTLARMALEGVLADGARGAVTIHPLQVAPAPAAASQPATGPGPAAHPTGHPTTRPTEVEVMPHAVG